MSVTNTYDVLLIEENPAFAKVFQCYLDGICGSSINTIEWTYDCTRGLELMRDHYFHIVFLDTDMLDSCLITMAHFITSKYKDSNTKIIAISFHNEPTYRDMMLRNGANKYLVKDGIEPDELASIFGIQFSQT